MHITRGRESLIIITITITIIIIIIIGFIPTFWHVNTSTPL